MDEVGVQGLLMEQGGFDPYAFPLEDPQSPEMLGKKPVINQKSDWEYY